MHFHVLSQLSVFVQTREYIWRQVKLNKKCNMVSPPSQFPCLIPAPPPQASYSQSEEVFLIYKATYQVSIVGLEGQLISNAIIRDGQAAELSPLV